VIEECDELATTPPDPFPPPRPGWCIERLGIASVSRASSCTLDKEVFKNELTLTAVQRAATTKACYFAVRRRYRRGLDPNDFVFCPAIRTIE
jgi:hypothetical protein